MDVFLTASGVSHHAGECVGAGIRFHSAESTPVRQQNAVSCSCIKVFLRAALKVFHALADNLNNGGLQIVSAGKASVTAS